MRIVGGTAKGRRLAAPAKGTRPTSDRAREAMFNTLTGTLRLDGARVLDLFAGTGAVGLEALSRGAAEAVLVEKNRAALDVLRKNVDAVGLPGATVVAQPVAPYVSGVAEQPFDLVFLDPPYALENTKVAGIVEQLHGRSWLGDEAHVVIERSARDGSPWTGSTFVTPVAEKRYGDSVLWYGRAR